VCFSFVFLLFGFIIIIIFLPCIIEIWQYFSQTLSSSTSFNYLKKKNSKNKIHQPKITLNKMNEISKQKKITKQEKLKK
jgi:hypothetical protein